jgi:hypothetical protein
VQLPQNRGPLEVSSNRVGGSIQVLQNSGGASIRNNTVNGNLQRKEFQGSKEDHCPRL